MSATAATGGYLAELLDAGLFLSTGVRGVYGLSGLFENVLEQFDAFVTRSGAHANPEVRRFPPLLPRKQYQRTDHLDTFPQLMGSVHSFLGDEREHLALIARKAAGEEWSTDLQATEVMLTPATCYPLYPTLTGTLPPGGGTFDLRSFVFRHEPSDDPARLQMFRMHEYIRVGSPDEALAHRDAWLRRGEEMLRALGLDVKPVVANDPFFGRGGRVMAATQREQALKFELVVTVTSEEKPTAIASSNYHLDHFGHAFDIRTSDGAVAHSGCVGFGLERVTLALFRKHGFDVARWPSEVRSVLAL
jgi:seryl-tRNA synthetase